MDGWTRPSSRTIVLTDEFLHLKEFRLSVHCNHTQLRAACPTKNSRAQSNPMCSILPASTRWDKQTPTARWALHTPHATTHTALHPTRPSGAMPSFGCTRRSPTLWTHRVWSTLHTGKNTSVSSESVATHTAKNGGHKTASTCSIHPSMRQCILNPLWMATTPKVMFVNVTLVKPALCII